MSGRWSFEALAARPDATVIAWLTEDGRIVTEERAESKAPTNRPRCDGFGLPPSADIHRDAVAFVGGLR